MPRDPDILRRQVADLRAYFRSALTDEDAAALAPGGSYIPMAPHGTRRQDARFTVAVHHRADGFVLHIRLYAGVALRQLPLEQRWAIECVLLMENTEVAAAEAAGCSARTLRNRLNRGLESISRMLWSDDGAQRLPPRKNGRP